MLYFINNCFKNWSFGMALKCSQLRAGLGTPDRDGYIYILLDESSSQFLKASMMLWLQLHIACRTIPRLLLHYSHL